MVKQEVCMRPAQNISTQGADAGRRAPIRVSALLSIFHVIYEEKRCWRALARRESLNDFAEGELRWPAILQDRV